MQDLALYKSVLALKKTDQRSFYRELHMIQAANEDELLKMILRIELGFVANKNQEPNLSLLSVADSELSPEDLEEKQKQVLAKQIWDTEFVPKIKRKLKEKLVIIPSSFFLSSFSSIWSDRLVYCWILFKKTHNPQKEQSKNPAEIIKKLQQRRKQLLDNKERREKELFV